jgi:hypothetical protein
MKPKQIRNALESMYLGGTLWLTPRRYVYHLVGKTYRMVEVRLQWGRQRVLPGLTRSILVVSREPFQLSEFQLYGLLLLSNIAQRPEDLFTQWCEPHRWREGQERLEAFRAYLGGLQAAELLGDEDAQKELQLRMSDAGVYTPAELVNRIDDILTS